MADNRDPGLVQIGSCIACGARAVLHDDACPDCVRRYGPQCGAIIRRIRSDRKFALLCYRLWPERGRRKFIEWFGDPSELRAVQ